LGTGADAPNTNLTVNVAADGVGERRLDLINARLYATKRQGCNCVCLQTDGAIAS